MNKGGKIVTSLFLGALLGAGVALIATPWSGARLREKLGLGVEDIDKKVERIRSKLHRLEEDLEPREIV